MKPAAVTSPPAPSAILSAPPATPGVLIDPTEAARVLTAMWSLREPALAERNVGGNGDVIQVTGIPATQPG